MAVNRRPIFRSNAIKYYIQGKERDILPRYLSRQVLICLWILLSICVVVGIYIFTELIVLLSVPFFRG